MARTRPPIANDALAEMLARDGELDKILSGRGLTFERRDDPPPPPPPQPFVIPEPDWDAEERERRERERLEREAHVRKEAAALGLQEAPRPTYPAKKKERKLWAR
jgi:hypothetical protein